MPAMYICICNALNEKQVQSAKTEGACSVKDMFRRLGCKPVCGQCVPMLHDALAQADRQAAEEMVA